MRPLSASNMSAAEDLCALKRGSQHKLHEKENAGIVLDVVPDSRE